MLTRLYAHNFRCLAGFETGFQGFNLLCGPNGAGKSSVFDVLRLIRDLASGDAVLGGAGERDIPSLEFTSWIESRIQEFEVGLSAGGHDFTYLVHLEQVTGDYKPRIIRERATCDDRQLFERDLDGVRFPNRDRPSGFPLDWRQAALGAIQPAGSREEIEALQKALQGLLILRPSPREMEAESKAEAQRPNLLMRNLTSWYRMMSQDQEWTNELSASLKQVWPDFSSFRLENVGIQTKALQLRFTGLNDPLFFHQLSDGEKALVALYMLRTALARGSAHTVLIDEPDNYIGLPELQPWLLSILELVDNEHQAILISHHPELLSQAQQDGGCYLWREDHRSPTRITPLKVPEGLTASEAVARGWVGV